MLLASVFAFTACENKNTETPHSHTEIIDPAVAPTCIEPGLTAGMHCSVCNEVIKAPEFIKPFGHTEVVDEAVVPTCTESGLTKGNHCAVCGEVLVEQETINAIGHPVVVDEAVDVTCTQAGRTEGKHCSVCGIVLVKQEIINALGHTVVVDSAVPPTCTESGLTEGRHCSICDEVLKTPEYIKPNGHSVVVDKAIASTCTSTGLTEGKHCYICNTVILSQQVTSVIACIESDWNIEIEATKTEDGLKYTECTMCGKKVSEETIPATGSIGLKYTLNQDGKSYSVEKGTCTDTEIVILSVYNGKPITRIADKAFYDCTTLKSVTIPDTVTSIGDNAFVRCTSLTTVTIPASVLIIGEEVFVSCQGLTQILVSDDNPNFVSIDGNVYSKDEKTFIQYASGKTNTSFTIPVGVEIIGKYAFIDSDSLKSVVLPNTITQIEAYAFYSCNSISNINIPYGVEIIGDYAFCGCNLTNIEIPQSVIKIGELAFAINEKLNGFNYAGSMEQWENIEKGWGWNRYIYSTKIYCIDGTIYE